MAKSNAARKANIIDIGVDAGTKSDLVKGFAERYENLRSQRADINAEISAVTREAKDKGFDRRALHEAIRRTKLSTEVRDNADQYELWLNQ